MADMTALQAAVEKTKSVEQSAIDLIIGISAQLKQMAETQVDQAALQAYADQLAQSADSLSEAVIANTPAAS